MQRRSDGTVFERGDNVLEYWLAHSEGFTIVSGGVRQRVAGVVVDPADGRARTMLVRAGVRGRTQAVPAARITAVDPFEKVLYLERRHAPRLVGRAHAAHVARAISPRATRLGTSLLALLRRGIALLVQLMRTGAAEGRRAIAWSLPHGRTAGLALRRASIRAARAADAAVRRWLPAVVAQFAVLAEVVFDRSRRLYRRLVLLRSTEADAAGEPGAAASEVWTNRSL